MAPWFPSCKIEAPSICYPTLPMLIQQWVPVGMQIPNPTPMIITSGSTAEDRDSQVIRQCTRTYSCVVHHHHEDHRKRTRREHKTTSPLIENRIERTDALHIPKQNKVQKWSDRYPNGSSRSTNHIVSRKLEKTGRHTKWGKNPKFFFFLKLKPIWPLGAKTPKIKK